MLQMPGHLVTSSSANVKHTSMDILIGQLVPTKNVTEPHEYITMQKRQPVLGPTFCIGLEPTLM